MVSYPAMHRLRQHVAWIVGVWLVCQTSAMILVPVSLCGRERGAAVEQACTCAHAAGDACPMHHAKPKSTSSCSCRSTEDGPTATLISLIGPVALLMPRTIVAASATASAPRVVPLFSTAYWVASTQSTHAGHAR
jgi:hypothetical protein